MLSAVQSAPDDSVGLKTATSAQLDLRRRSNVYGTRDRRRMEYKTIPKISSLSEQRGSQSNSNLERLRALPSDGHRRSFTTRFSSRLLCDEDLNSEKYCNKSPSGTSPRGTWSDGAVPTIEQLRYSDKAFRQDDCTYRRQLLQQYSLPVSRRAFSTSQSLRATDWDKTNSLRSDLEPRTPQLARRNSMTAQIMRPSSVNTVEYDNNNAATPPTSVLAPRTDRGLDTDDTGGMAGVEYSDNCSVDMATGSNTTEESSQVERISSRCDHKYSEDALSDTADENGLTKTDVEAANAQTNVQSSISKNSTFDNDSRILSKGQYSVHASNQISPDMAATKIGMLWFRYKRKVARRFEELVYSIELARQVAALTLERYWRGYRARKFVYDEVCRTRIVYWNPSMANQDEALLECYTVNVRGGFTVPPWTVSFPLRYCRHRKIYIAYLKVSAGTYPCKFVVNGEQRTCPWLYPTVLDRDGFENSAVTLAEHPQKTWWSARLNIHRKRAGAPISPVLKDQ